MALNNLNTTLLRDVLCDAFVDAIDGGGAAGLLEIWSGLPEEANFTTKLATLTFTYPGAYGNSASGTAQEASITDDASADATGTARHFRVTTSTPATLFEGTVGTSGEDINFNSILFVAGDTVSITDLPVTMPAS